MKRFRKTITALFGFDRRERRGTYILSLILVILVLFRFIGFRPGRVQGELPPLPVVPEARMKSIELGSSPVVLFFFDPNTCTYNDLLRLGLSPGQARTLVNYRSSGARFRRPEDILRVYGIDTATAAVLIPYINIDKASNPSAVNRSEAPYNRQPGGKFQYGRSDSVRNVGTRAWENSQAAISGAGRSATPGMIHGEEEGSNRDDYPLLDLNLCSAADLEALPGVGPVLASRITRYRSLLGGYIGTGQLAEVYGLDSAVINLIAGRLTVTFDSVRPLVLDSATFGDLARHPYLGYEAARKITRYRSMATTPVTLGEMAAKGVISAAQAERIAPYVMPSRGVVRSDYEFISSKVLK